MGQYLFLYFIFTISFCLSFPLFLLSLYLRREAGDFAGHHPRGQRGLHGEARHRPGSATQRGAGAGRAGAQHLMLEAGAQHAQSHRAASQTGRTGGEFNLLLAIYLSMSIELCNV